MNSYEHTFIAKQDLTESQSKSLVDKYTNIIKENSGKIVKIEEWGLKNFQIIYITIKKVSIFI